MKNIKAAKQKWLANNKDRASEFAKARHKLRMLDPLYVEYLRKKSVHERARVRSLRDAGGFINDLHIDLAMTSCKEAHKWGAKHNLIVAYELPQRN